MRICDICFCELKEEGTYEIKDGVRTDNCGKCLDRLRAKYTQTDIISQYDDLPKDYKNFLDEKENNIEKLLFKISDKSIVGYTELFVTEDK